MEVMTVTFRDGVDDYRAGDTITGDVAQRFLARGVDPSFYFVTRTVDDNSANDRKE